MTASQIEDAIVARLRDQLLEHITVEAAPEDPGQYAVRGAKGCVLVRYTGSTYSPPEQLAVVQQRASQVTVLRGARSLRVKEGHQGVLEIMEAAIQALTLFNIEPGGWRKIYVQSDELIREEKGVWWYGFTVIIPNDLYL